MRTLLLMAWRNVMRHRRRSLLTALGMGLAVGICLTMLSMVAGMYGMMRDVVVTRTLGHVVVQHEDYPGRRNLYDVVPDADALTERLAALPGSPGVAGRLFGAALVGSDARTSGAQLVGIDPAAEASLRHLDDKVSEGDWLAPAAEGGILLGAGLADELEVGVGDTVVAVTQAADGSLGNVLFEVRGLVRTGSTGLDRAGGFVHLDDLRDLLALEGGVHELTIIGSDDSDEAIAALVAEVRGVLPGQAIARTWAEVEPTMASMFGMQAVTKWLMIGFFYGVAAVGVVNTLLMSVFERTREFGVLRALGLRPRELVALVMLESFVIAVLALGIGGLIGAAGITYLVEVGVDLTVREGESFTTGAVTFDPVIKGRVVWADLVEPVVGALGFAVIAGVWPALRAARLRPVDALRGA